MLLSSIKDCDNTKHKIMGDLSQKLEFSKNKIHVGLYKNNQILSTSDVSATQEVWGDE